MGFLSLYSSLLTKRPIATKMATATFIQCCGDITCQYLEQKKKSRSDSSIKGTRIDFKRMMRQGFMGFILTPLMHLYLVRVVPKYVGFVGPFKNGTAFARINNPFNTVWKVAVHNICITPIMQSCILFGIAFLKYDYSA